MTVIKHDRVFFTVTIIVIEIDLNIIVIEIDLNKLASVKVLPGKHLL